VCFSVLASFALTEEPPPPQTQASPAEDFSSLVKHLQREKPAFAKRQQDLLEERYDLADRPVEGATMSKGRPIQAGA